VVAGGLGRGLRGKEGKGKEVSWVGLRARGPCSAGRKEKGGGPVLAVGPWCV
jgi:hypothetical protein